MPNYVMNMVGSAVATISNGQTLSSAINLDGLRLFGFVMPSAWTAANLTFQASFDGGTTWVNMYDSNGNELSITCAASRFVALDPVYYASVPMLKIRSGTSATPVAQGQDTAITLVLRSV